MTPMQGRTSQGELSSWQATTAAVAMPVAGVLAYMFMPLMIGGIGDGLGLSPDQLGLIGAAEAGGMALANIIAVLWIRRWDWRRTSICGILLMILANLASWAFPAFLPILIARTVDGFAGGALIAIGVAAMSDNRQADRVFGYFIATEMMLSSIGFLVLPDIISRFGVEGLFLALALLSAGTLIFVPWLSRHGIERRVAAGPAVPSALPRMTLGISIIALVGAFLFFTSQGGLWAFIERIGKSANIASDDISLALAISSLAGIAGALGANRVVQGGLFKALLLVLAGEVVSLALLLENPDPIRFYLAASLFIALWSMALPVLLIQFNRLDPAGHLVILLYAVGKLGYMAGPAAMGFLVANDNYTLPILASCILCVAGLLLLIGLTKFDRPQRGDA